MFGEKLFGDFPPVSREEWEALIRKELKDRDPASIRVTVGDKVLEPFHTTGVEGADGRRRGVKRTDNAWRATVGIDANDPNANKLALEALVGGADALEFYGKPKDLHSLLKDVWVGAIDLWLDGDAKILDELLAVHAKQETPASQVSICLGLPHDADVSALKDRIAKHPRIRLFSISDRAFPPSAFSLQLSTEALEQGKTLVQHLLSQGYSIDDACARLQFRLHLSDDLFVEAARLRAFRETWAALVDEFSPQHDCSHNTWIQAVVSYPAETK